MLTVCNLTKVYPGEVYANNNISFALSAGETVWISGATGSGKTTLLNMLAAIDTPDSGIITWGEHTLSSMNDTERAEFRLKRMGLVFQSLELMKALSAYDNVALPLRYTGLSPSLVKRQVDEIFAFLDISFLIKKMPAQMSGGQQQRVALARALVHHPRYVLGDEISSALDSETADFIYRKMKTYIKEQGGVGILISHDPSVAHYVNRRMEMKDGVLEEMK